LIVDRVLKICENMRGQKRGGKKRGRRTLYLSRKEGKTWAAGDYELEDKTGNGNSGREKEQQEIPVEGGGKWDLGAC